MRNICIVTIADAINGTSMPINEFVIYRAYHDENSSQVLIVCTDENYNGVKMPNNVAVYFVTRDVKQMRKVVKSVIQKCNKESLSFVFHIHGQSSASVFIAATIFMNIRKYTVFTVHSLCSARNFKYRMSSYICALYANFITCVSNSVFQDYPMFIKKIKRCRIKAITNAIDVSHLEEYISMLPRHQDVCDMKRLICVDRVVPLKNQVFLINLLKSLPDSKLILVGTPSFDGRLEALAKDLGVFNQVEFTGLLNREDVYNQLNLSGIYVSASKIEGLHNSVLEAIGIGVIPVISDIPAHREIAKKIGLFDVMAFEENQWINYIQNIQNMNKDELSSLSLALKDSLKNNFSLDTMHLKYDEVYRSLLN